MIVAIESATTPHLELEIMGNISQQDLNAAFLQLMNLDKEDLASLMVARTPVRLQQLHDLVENTIQGFYQISDLRTRGKGIDEKAWLFLNGVLQTLANIKRNLDLNPDFNPQILKIIGLLDSGAMAGLTTVTINDGGTASVIFNSTRL